MNHKKSLTFICGESGSPIGLQYRLSSYAEDVFDVFYFVKNLQGDIVAIYNESGTLIGSYTYDAWGNCTATVESGNTTLENSIVNTYNPFRYRGYYYDAETSMYYLQSRYYVPAWGRFLNADGYVNANGDLIGFNMYAYCSNNPVMYTDESGQSIIAAALIGAGISVGIEFIFQLIENKGDLSAIDPIDLLKAGFNGALSGSLGAGFSAVATEISKHFANQSLQFFIRVVGNMIGDGVADVMAGIATDDITSISQAADTFVNGAILSFIGQGINIKTRQLKEYRFNGFKLDKQRSVLTHTVFKNGNFYMNWSWNTFKNTDQFNSYLNSWNPAIGNAWKVATGFLSH